MIGWFKKKISVDDLMECLDELPLADRHRILTEAVKELFNTIGPDDILRIRDDGVWMFEDRQLTQPEIENLKKSAEAFRKSLLWKVLKKDIQYQTNQKMFVNSAGELDIIAGKIWLYAMDAIQSRITKM